jgi:cyclophilin family peptidyl-prolyl cis-trans isomerase
LIVGILDGGSSIVAGGHIGSSAVTVSASDAELIACAERKPECSWAWAETAPAAFVQRLHTTVGPVDVRITTASSPAAAARAFLLARLGYADGAPFYRVLVAAGGGGGGGEQRRFVAQWGYRGSPAVDGAWLSLQTSNATAAVVPPGNVRGSVALGTSEVAGPLPPYCTAAACSQGFSVEFFVNLGNNSRLDDADFSTFGEIDEAGMARIDRLYSGYGECADLCAQDASSPYCVPAPGGGWAGVNLTRWLLEGESYLHAFPLLDRVVRTELLPLSAAPASA